MNYECSETKFHSGACIEWKSRLLKESWAHEAKDKMVRHEVTMNQAMKKNVHPVATPVNLNHGKLAIVSVVVLGLARI